MFILQLCESVGYLSGQGCNSWNLVVLNCRWLVQTTISTGGYLAMWEGNGTPLQYSCLENPMDGGAWCTAVYGVAQSWTRLKWLSSKHNFMCFMASLIVQLVKNMSAMQETWVQSLGQVDPLEKEMANHSSILAWKMPRTEEPGGLQSMGSHELDMT